MRRLRGAAVLLSQFVAAGLLPSLTSLVRQGHARLLPKAFGVADPASPGGALIGESRAADLVVNTVLPAVHAAARSRGSRRLEAACRHLYEAFPPLQENELIREAHHLLGEMMPRNVVTTACRQQGLLHLYRQMLATAPPRSLTWMARHIMLHKGS